MHVTAALRLNTRKYYINSSVALVWQQITHLQSISLQILIPDRHASSVVMHHKHLLLLLSAPAAAGKLMGADRACALQQV